MNQIIALLWALLPWAVLMFFALAGYVLVGWARKRKSGAVVFGAFVQMVLPDPYAERTIQIVSEEKQQKGQTQAGDTKPEKDS